MSDIKAPFMGAIPYTGNKQKLLPHLLELFPNTHSYSTFIDLFAGGCSVGLTMSSLGKQVVANEIDSHLIGMYRDMEQWEDLSLVKGLMATYGLCKTNKDAFIHFRDEVYNRHPTSEGLYTLILHSFSNLNRRNNDGEFNASFGYRSLNNNTEKRFKHFKENCQNITFTQKDYREFGFFEENTFVYCDPPYLITDAVYNKGWTEQSDQELFNYLDRLTSVNIKWGMSNVVAHRGEVNKGLLKWMEKYNTHYLDSKYVLGAHILDDKELSSTVEVYVCNY